jgi:SAM-dependent methyltransferase
MNKRERFLLEIVESILMPYEVSETYEEEIIGEFENRFEVEYFERFFVLLGKEGGILDLACGDGRHTLRLAERANHVVALDLSPNNLKMAKKKCQARGNITFIEGSMFDLPFSANTFDGIWFSQAFEYVPPDKREQLLASLCSILKPSGVLYMSVETWTYPSLLASAKELLRDLWLYLYWKFLKGKPLMWGEYLYYLSPEVAQVSCSCWHYHVHTDKWALFK